jgi:hypothetical protein
VGHVGEELGLVPRAERELFGAILEGNLRGFDLLVLHLDVAVLALEQARLLGDLVVGVLQLARLQL